jgi:hypothetical protein
MRQSCQLSAEYLEEISKHYIKNSKEMGEIGLGLDGGRWYFARQFESLLSVAFSDRRSLYRNVSLALNPLSPPKQ